MHLNRWHFESTKTPHISPSQVSYGSSIVNVLGRKLTMLYLRHNYNCWVKPHWVIGLCTKWPQFFWTWFKTRDGSRKFSWNTSVKSALCPHMACPYHQISIHCKSMQDNAYVIWIIWENGLLTSSSCIDQTLFFSKWLTIFSFGYHPARRAESNYYYSTLIFSLSHLT